MGKKLTGEKSLTQDVFVTGDRKMFIFENLKKYNLYSLNLKYQNFLLAKLNKKGLLLETKWKKC